MQYINLTPHPVFVQLKDSETACFSPLFVGNEKKLVLRAKSDEFNSELGMAVKKLTPYFAYVDKDGKITPLETDKMPRLFICGKGKIRFVVSLKTLIATGGSFMGVRCVAPSGVRVKDGVKVASYLMTI